MGFSEHRQYPFLLFAILMASSWVIPSLRRFRYLVRTRFHLFSTMACKNTPHVHEASPGTRMLFLSIYLSYLLHMIPCSYWASTCLAVLPSYSAYMLRVTSGRRFANRFLQIPPHDGHPCLKLYPSHYRADSGLAPVRTCARRAQQKQR